MRREGDPHVPAPLVALPPERLELARAVRVPVQPRHGDRRPSPVLEQHRPGGRGVQRGEGILLALRLGDRRLVAGPVTHGGQCTSPSGLPPCPCIYLEASPCRISRSSACSTSAGRSAPRTRRTGRLLLYDAKDLVTHAVCVGMTGSGKTGLCIGLLEEAALDGVPAVVIDPKGDLANLLLTFPDLKPSDFLPWINEDDARRKSMTPEQYAEQQAAAVEEGPGRLGAGRGAHPAPARRGRVRHLHPGKLRGHPGLDPEVLRRAGGRDPRRPGPAARADRHHGDQPAVAARRRGRPAEEPRAHPALLDPRDGCGRRAAAWTWPASSARSSSRRCRGSACSTSRPSSPRRNGTSWP